jgi:rSAM/selenodomain-associated transferase 1
MNELGILCVFAKPPVAGQVKTRLAARLGAEPAASVARALFADTWAQVRSVGWARCVVASTHLVPEAFGVGPEHIWLQGEGDLGARLERIFERALSEAPWALALGADCPVLPSGALEAARRALQTHDAVLGPAHDGGFYLLGLRRLVPGLLQNLPWSSNRTHAATHERLVSRNLTVTQVEAAFDVDELPDLVRLRALLLARPALAPNTAALLDSFADRLAPGGM